MEKFQTKASPVYKKCDAKRCKEDSVRIFEEGTKLCERHVSMLTEADLEQLGSDERREQPTQNTDDQNEVIQKYVEPYKEEAEEIVTQLADFEIRDNEAAEIASNILKEVHENIKKLEKKRKEVTTPLNTAIKTLNSWFKPAVNSMEEAKTLIKARLNEWIEIQENARLAAFGSGNTAEAIEMPAPVIPEGMSTRITWTYEVEDINAVPRELLVLDEKAVKALMKENDPESLEIPGIRIFQKSSVAVGR